MGSDVGGELCGMDKVKRGIFRKCDERFWVGGQGAAEHRLVNEVHSKPRGVMTGCVRDVVAKLVFLLIAQDWERGNGGDELIVTEGFETGDGAGRGAKWKSERESEMVVARRREM